VGVAFIVSLLDVELGELGIGESEVGELGVDVSFRRGSS
jgi:hypothetical protein